MVLIFKRWTNIGWTSLSYSHFVRILLPWGYLEQFNTVMMTGKGSSILVFLSHFSYLTLIFLILGIYSMYPIELGVTPYLVWLCIT